MEVEERWTDEAALRESERWVHVPREGTCIEDERRLLVHLPKRWGTSRVWRTWVADEGRAGDLVEETIGEVRAAGGGRLVWHTGDRVAPPFMHECLTSYGFQTTEKLEVLAFALVEGHEPEGHEPQLPRIGVPEDFSVGLVRDAETMWEALRVDSEVFCSPPPSGKEFPEYVAELEKLRRRERGEPSGEGASLAVRFGAYLNSTPECEGNGPRNLIAAAGAQLVGETLRLWGAATRETFRGQGAYGALVLERCRVGKRLGATLALAKANISTSGSILKRAGFRRIAGERRHTLELHP